MNALETFSGNRLDTGKAHTFRRPVAGRTLTVVSASDDDQRLLALHVGFDGFPHAHDLAFRLHARQRTLFDLAVFHDHFVEQFRVGEGRALGRQVVATVGGVGVEVLFRQAHFRQVFAGGAVEHDRVRWRQVISGDVVRQHRQRAHALQRTGAGQRAFPVRRTADVGAHLAPVVQRRDFRPGVFMHGEHRNIDLTELLRLDRRLHHRIDFFIARPDVLEADFPAIDHAQHILLDIETDGPGDRVSNHQRRRGEECLFGVRVNAAVEVAVAGEHRGRVQIAVDDLLLDQRIEGAGHAVASGAGKRHDAETELFQLSGQPRFVEVQRHGFRTRRQRGFDPRFARQAEPVGIARQQASGDDVARVAGVGATGDGGDDHRAVGHLPRYVIPLAGDAFGRQIRYRNAGVRVARAGHVAHHRGQIEGQAALVLRAFQAVSPQAGEFGVLLDQLNLLVFTTGQFQVIDGLLVDVEHRRRGAVFRGHVGDGRAVAEGQRRRAFAEKLQPGANDFLLAQVFGQGQDHVGSGDARLQLARQFDANAFRQAHPRRATEHHALGFEAADTDGDHAQRIDVRRVAVGADAGVRERHAFAHLNHRGHFLQVDLVHDAVARRDHIDVLEGLFGPVDEVETVFVAAIFDGAVLLEGLGIETARLDGQRVVDDQLRRHHRVDLRRVAALQSDGIAQASEVDQRGLAEDVMADHPRREPREIEIAFAFDQLLERVGERGRVAATHKVFRQHAGGVRQGVVAARRNRLDRRAGVEVIQRRAGQVLAEFCVHRVRTRVTVVAKGGPET